MIQNLKFEDHLNDYIFRLKSTFNKNIDCIEQLAKEIINIWDNNNKIFICGNGGSGANAIHIANDFHYGLGNGVSKEKMLGMNVESLVSNQEIETCLANDTGYENIFYYQLEVKASSRDLLIVLSGSGNSQNVVKALKTANEKGIKSYAILGFDGGLCKELASKVIHFEIDDMLISEDLQMITFNICFQWIIKLKKSLEVN